MYPHEHFLLAVVPVAMFSFLFLRKLPSGKTTLILLIASQFPDLIDKPLAFSLQVLPSGRMLAHSVVVSVPLLLALIILATRYGRTRDALVFVFGYMSHLVGDFYRVFTLGTEYHFYPNIFWPLLEANTGKRESFAAFYPESTADLLIPVGILLLGLAYSVFMMYASRSHSLEKSPKPGGP
ncbi:MULTISPECIES: metal-dependent hydrolase [Haloarcula]|uniref:metal-dependent hydrolase n=1 Tax=Haloarcula TaxID=2237 RepID=UPI0023EDB2FA|nr:metal-dependent hydrolase [Halomicroarcula sp. XH51]